MEETLHGRVIGQDEAVVAIARAIRRARVGLKNPNRPIASFIFSGPTGVGKSELAKVTTRGSCLTLVSDFCLDGEISGFPRLCICLTSLPLQTLATYYFGSEDAMVRLDMSEFMERHTVSKLIGSPPGYVGYNEGGQLTEVITLSPWLPCRHRQQ